MSYLRSVLEWKCLVPHSLAEPDVQGVGSIFTQRQSDLRMSVIVSAKRPSSAPYGCMSLRFVFTRKEKTKMTGSIQLRRLCRSIAVARAASARQEPSNTSAIAIAILNKESTANENHKLKTPGTISEPEFSKIGISSALNWTQDSSSLRKSKLAPAH